MTWWVMNWFIDSTTACTFLVGAMLISIFHPSQVKLPFEKLIHALRNFPEDAMDPDTLLPMAYSIKVHPFNNENWHSLNCGWIFGGYAWL